MKNYLARQGFEAEGYVAPLEVLGQARVPAIALIRDHGFTHFVVIKGVRGDRVLLGDPSSGTRAVTRAHFEKTWVSRTLFVIRSHPERARFDMPEDWKVAPAAPLGSVINQGVADTTLIRRGPNDH
jgi:predicted double-glycine peptidase